MEEWLKVRVKNWNWGWADTKKNPRYINCQIAIKVNGNFDAVIFNLAPGTGIFCAIKKQSFAVIKNN